MTTPTLDKVRVPPPSFFDRFSIARRAERAACILWNIIAEAGDPTIVASTTERAFVDAHRSSINGNSWNEASLRKFCSYVDLCLSSQVPDNCYSLWQAVWRLYQRPPEEMDRVTAPLATTFLKNWWTKALTTSECPDPTRPEIQNEGRRIAAALGLTADMHNSVSTDIFRVCVRDYWLWMIEEAKAGTSVSPDERQTTASLISQYKIDMPMNTDDQRLLNRAEVLYRIEQGFLTPINVSLSLRKGELAYFATRATLIGTQKVKVRDAQTTGAGVSVPTLGGASAYIGSYTHVSAEYEGREKKVFGDLFVTSKRIMFISDTTLTINWSQVLDLKKWVSGERITIVRDTGKEVDLLMNDSLDRATLMALSERIDR